MAIPTPTAYYKLDGNATDSVGSNNGTATNVSYVTGKIGQGASFNGSSSSISLASDLGIASGSSFSCSFWVKMNTEITTGEQNFFSLKSNTDGVLYYIGYEYNAGNLRILFDRIKLGVLNQRFYHNVALGTSSYRHIVATYDGSAIKMYLDNSLVGTLNGVSGNGNPAGSNFSLGENLLLNAIMDEVYVTNTALTAGQVSELYNAGAGISYPFATIVAMAKQTINSSIKSLNQIVSLAKQTINSIAKTLTVKNVIQLAKQTINSSIKVIKNIIDDNFRNNRLQILEQKIMAPVRNTIQVNVPTDGASIFVFGDGITVTPTFGGVNMILNTANTTGASTTNGTSNGRNAYYLQNLTKGSYTLNVAGQMSAYFLVYGENKYTPLMSWSETFISANNYSIAPNLLTDKNKYIQVEVGTTNASYTGSATSFTLSPNYLTNHIKQDNNTNYQWPAQNPIIAKAIAYSNPETITTAQTRVFTSTTSDNNGFVLGAIGSPSYSSYQNNPTSRYFILGDFSATIKANTIQTSLLNNGEEVKISVLEQIAKLTNTIITRAINFNGVTVFLNKLTLVATVKSLFINTNFWINKKKTVQITTLTNKKKS